MAELGLSAAKIILLAVRAASSSDIGVLRTLVAQHRKTLRIDLVLRLLLTFLPESLESSEYVQFLNDLASGQILADSNPHIELSHLDGVSDEEANKKVRKLHLAPLRWPSISPDTPQDHLVLFLIQRAHRVDEATGLIGQLPGLIVPFLDHSPYLRTWMISTLLPLLRLSYEYYPAESITMTIGDFETLDDRAGVNFLLSNTGRNVESTGDPHRTIGRDLRGLLGPWMYGNSRWKRRKLRRASSADAQAILSLDHTPTLEDHKCGSWEEVFKWVTSQATISWITCVQVIEQWDGPGDVDIGGYGDGAVWLDEGEQKYLEGRYARTALAAAYLIPEASEEALTGVHQILGRVVALLDYDRIPSLSAAAALLSPIRGISEGALLSPNNAVHLRTGLLDHTNPLTAPKEVCAILLHALLISAFLLTRVGVQCTIRHAGELALLQDEKDQMYAFQRFIHTLESGPKGDDKYWIRMRNEILWLRNWGELVESSETSHGKGVFGQIKKDFMETEILKSLLSNTRYTLAQSIYESSLERPLSIQQVQETVVFAAMNAYDNATNANRTRGGVKKCDEIIHAFPGIMAGSLAQTRIGWLLEVTHTIGQYRLVLRQGEPFTPVILRVHDDPISLIGKLLDQNPKSYTRITELLRIGELMVISGLTARDIEGHTILTPEQEKEQILISCRRITSMCIDAALAENDFETAYSYVMNRLSSIASEAQSRTPILERKGSGLFAHTAPRVLDDWSWRAALQAGKYRMNSYTIKPTHLGNASGNLEIRHLEQRMECLSQALRISPPNTLQEILNVYRRCEEELDTKIKEEADQEAAWDEEADANTMPGAFGADPPVNFSRAGASTGNASSRTGVEAPMSLFDLTRATAARAQTSLSSLTVSKRSTGAVFGSTNTEEIAHDLDIKPATIRKRDQLTNVATNVALGATSWLLGVNPPPAQRGQQ